MPILLLKEYDLKSHIKGYNAYMKKWNPTIGELLKARLEPENEYDKFAVAVERFGAAVGHLTRVKTGCFIKPISFFYVQAMEIVVQVEVTGKRVNLGDG